MKRLGGVPELQMVETPSDFKAATIFGRLDLACVNPHDITLACTRLSAEFGPKFEPFYRRVCAAIASGTEPIARLIEAYEEAHRCGVRNRGAAFISACKRTMDTFRHESDPMSVPAPQANRQIS